MKKLLFIFLIILNLKLISCQSLDNENGSVFVIDSRVHWGMVVKNYMSTYFPIRKPCNLIDVNIAKQTIGKKYWHKLYNYPQVGVSVVTGSFGNPEELGYTFGLVPNLSFNTLRNKKINLTVNLGLGLGYFNN